MRVIFEAPTELEATDVAVSDDRKAMSVRPSFYQAKGKATAGVIRVTSEDGTVHFRGVVQVNGKTGYISIEPRTKAVLPDMDKKKAGKK